MPNLIEYWLKLTTQKSITKHGERVDDNRCRGLILLEFVSTLPIVFRGTLIYAIGRFVLLSGVAVPGNLFVAQFIEDCVGLITSFCWQQIESCVLI